MVMKLRPCIIQYSYFDCLEINDKGQQSSCRAE